MLYTFNNIELDTKNYRLKVDCVEQAIEPQVFNLIVYLIQHKAQVLSRDEILDNVWKGKNVSDSTISNHIKSARKALGDDGYKQKVIKTIHSRGYQFVAECKTVDKPSSITTSSDDTHPKLKILLLVLLIILIALISVWFLKQNTKSLELSEKRDHSIAVLAFKDLSPESNQAYFAEGMSEELLNLFTHIDGLSVASRTSSFSFKNKDVTLEQIGKELNVNYVIEGSVRKSGEKLRVTAQLIRVEDGSHLWSETYDYQLHDIFKIQDNIAESVSQQLKLSLAKGMKKDQPINPKAQVLYLQSLYYFRENSEDSLNKALSLIDESLKLDEFYTAAWTLKSRIHYQRAVYSYDKDDSTELTAAQSAVIKAKALNNNDATVNAQLALLNLSEFDFESAQFNTELAMSINDKSLQTMTIISQYYQLTGQLDKSIEVLKKIEDASPINDIQYFSQAINQWSSNDLESAYNTIKKYGYFHKKAIGHYAFKSLILAASEEIERAKQEAKKETNPFWKIAALEYVYFAEGDTNRADELLEQMIKEYAYSPAYIASLYERRLDKDNAFKWLNVALENGDMKLLYVLNIHTMSNLWDDERMGQLIANIGFKNDHWYFEKVPDSSSISSF